MDLKLAIISSVYPYPERGCWPGIERLVEGLSEALVKRGVDVSVITSYRLGGEREFEMSPEKVKIFRVRSLMEYKYWGIFALNAASFSFSAFKKHLGLMRESDLINVFAVSLIPTKPLKNMLPSIVSHFTHLDLPTSIKELLYIPYVNFLQGVLFRYSDVITAGIPPNSSDLLEFMHFYHVPSDKIRFVYEGVDIRKFNSKVNATEIRNKFNENFVLYVGPLVPRKGLAYLIKAVPIVVQKVPDVKFVLVGKGEQERYLKNLSRKMGVKEHVFFEGFVPESKLPKYYTAADVFAFPTLREGYPLACLEAMASGTPVVATNLNTISTIVGDTGVLVEPRKPNQLAQGIIYLLKNSTMRKKLGRNTEKRAIKNFAWNKIAERMIKIYQEAMILK